MLKIYSLDLKHEIIMLHRDYSLYVVKNLWYSDSFNEKNTDVRSNPGLISSDGPEFRKWADDKAKGEIILIKGTNLILFERQADVESFKKKWPQDSWS